MEESNPSPNAVETGTETPETAKLRESPEANGNEIKHVKQHQQEDDIKVKPEYILSELHPTLTPPTDPRSSNDANENSNQKQKENRHKKNKRELKKRSLENDGNSKLCKAFSMGNVCPFGDDCKFSHDVKEVLNSRVEDIKEIDGCPHFDLKG